jgi:protein-tyrosine phosphatase
MTNRVLKYYLFVHTGKDEPVLVPIPNNNNEMTIDELTQLIFRTLRQQSVQINDNDELYLNDIHLNHKDNLSKTIQQMNISIQGMMVDEENESNELYTIIRNATDVFIKNDVTNRLYNVLSNFKNQQFDTSDVTSATDKKLELPASLTSIERKFAHAICEDLQLHHQSHGSGANRHIVVMYRKNVGKQSVKKTSKKAVVTTETRQSKSNIPKGMSTVLPDFLYLGSGRDANDIEQITENKITHILNCTAEWPAYHALPETITLKRISIKDMNNVNITEHLDDCHNFLDQVRQNGGRAFVHCTIGRSRSASVVLSYLMRSEKMSLGQAYNHLFSCRDIIKPNDGFMKQLMAFEHKLYNGEYSTAELLSTSLPWTFTETPAPTEQELEQLREEKRLEAEKLDKFAEEIVTDEFLQRIVQEELGGQMNQEAIGTFIQRVQKSAGDLVDQRTEYPAKVLRSAIGKRTREWYVRQLKSGSMSE